MNKKLLTLGCSLASKHSWPDHTREQLNILPENHTHFSFGGGDNSILIELLHEYFCTNSYSETVVIYEMTGIGRKSEIISEYSRLKKSHELVTLDPDREYSDIDPGKDNWITYKTVFGNKENHILYGFHEYIDEHLLPNAEITLSTVVNTLSMLAQTPADVVMFRGWSGACPSEYWEVGKEIMESRNVWVCDVPLVDWCLENHLEMREDGWHPAIQGHHEYANQILVPFIKKHLDNQ